MLSIRLFSMIKWVRKQTLVYVINKLCTAPVPPMVYCHILTIMPLPHISVINAFIGGKKSHRDLMQMFIWQQKKSGLNIISNKYVHLQQNTLTLVIQHSADRKLSQVVLIFKAFYHDD